MLSLSYGRVIVKDPERLHGLVPDSFETYQVLDPGDIVIRGTDLQNDQVSLRVGQSKNRGIITSAYIALETLPGILPEYAYRYLSSCDTTKVFYGLGTGLRQNLSFKDFKTLPTLLPPLDEQAAIVKYLAHVDRKIDRFIRSKRRMIELLNEQKQAIIHQAVTKGLDPSVPMKDSGVEWLGEIPAHWEISRLKDATQIERGRFSHRPRNDPDLYAGPYPFVQTGDVSRASKTICDYTQTLNERGFSVSRLFKRGSLLMTIAANIGDVAILGFDSCLPDSVVSISPRALVNSEFLYYSLRDLKPQLQLLAPVNTQGNLNVSRLGGVCIAVPPQGEQDQITGEIEQRLSQVDRAVNRSIQEIGLIREYRTRLVSDVVTGKVDVRSISETIEVNDLFEADSGYPVDEVKFVDFDSDVEI